MSPILINSTSNVVPKNNFVDEEKSEEDTEKAREERKATGRSIAIIIFLSLMCLALYHVIQRKTTILAGVLVPALILFAYTFFVIHISNRDKKKRKQLEATELELVTAKINNMRKTEVNKNFPTTSNLSKSSNIAPSTSGKQFSPTTSAAVTKQFSSNGSFRSKPSSSSKAIKNSNDLIVHASASSDLKKIPSFHKKIPSQAQVKSNQSAQMMIENEMMRMKKSRSSDRSNQIETRQAIDNKRVKTKH